MSYLHTRKLVMSINRYQNFHLFSGQQFSYHTKTNHSKNIIISVSGSRISFLGMDAKQGKSVNWLFFKINQLMTMLIERSRRDIFIRMYFTSLFFK